MSASTFALTDVQREFRATLRTFCEEKVAPHAAEVDRDAEFPWKSFKACKEMELPALGIPEAYGGAGADTSPRPSWSRSSPGVRVDLVTMLISKLGMMPIMNWGSEDLKQRLHAPGGVGRDPGQLLPVGGRRRQRRGRHAVPGGARRRQLRPVGLEVLDHQRRGLGHLHRVRQDRPRRRRARHLVLPGRGGLGRPRSPSSRTRWGCGAARPARSCSTTCGSRRRTASARRARASRSPCTRWTAAGPPSGPRRWASPRAPSTTRPRT